MEDQAQIMDGGEVAPELRPDEMIAVLLNSENLAVDLEDDKVKQIANEALADYDLDKQSMGGWFERMQRGLDLARMMKEEKDTPFKGASNVKYPLLTSAALQFNARAYPAIVPADRPVKVKVWGKDQDGSKAARAERVSEHMSHQLQVGIPEWEESTDDLLMQLSIVGQMYRKWWVDPATGRKRCRLVEPGKLIVNDKVKSFSDAPRCTEELPLYPHEIETRIRTGYFAEFKYDRTGEDDDAPHDFIEQHTRLDLDEDGYEEPYIATIHCETKTLVRLVADFSEEDVSYETEERVVQTLAQVQDPLTRQVIMVPSAQRVAVPVRVTAINRGTYFVPFKFLPGLDGGFNGTGLGLLLGDIAESIDTIINMLLDAGHYASLGGGFIGSEFRMKGGAAKMRPGEWRMTETRGADMRSGIVPLTFPGPDATLFSLLGMLIDAGREISSVKDVVTGEQPRQQQTATTTLALIEQGMMVFTAAYKRIFRSCKEEYKLLAKLNAKTVSPEEYQTLLDEPADPAADYNPADLDIEPVADPRSVTKMQQAAKAQFVMQLAEMGLVDRNEALLRIAEAMDVEDVEDLLPKPDPMAQQMQAMQMQAVQADLAEKMANVELTLAKVDAERASIQKMMMDAKNDADKLLLEARKQRMDGLFGVLEEERARLEAVLRKPGGMENRPGDGNTSGGNGQAYGGPERRAVEGLLAGATAPGGGQGGLGIGGGMG